MTRLPALVLVVLAAATAGCRSNPYCLNCKDSGNGVVSVLPDMVKPADLTPNPATLTDMTGMNNGMCVPTNGGVEACDGLDNDCNGLVDDVNPSKLQGDGNNCGACGHICSYLHAVGVCTNAMCSMGACQPGWIDLDNNPANGCEYACQPTQDPTEICDGKDNNCDGQVDEGFTATWSDPQHQHPLYDDNVKDCGQCGKVCSLGPGTIMACQASAPGQSGQCVVSACFNGLDKNGKHVTYRSDGNKATLGCQYLCPFASAETGVDCDVATCTFPPEICNGLDDDCNFMADDGAAQPPANTRCPDGTPNKLCSDGLSGTQSGQCVGQCAAGTEACINGAIVCNNSTGPSPETCDDVDNDCNTRIDDPFTATWFPNGQPRYDSSPSSCGSCAGACNLANAVSGCHSVASAAGSCFVIACKPQYAWVPMTGTVAGTCNTPAPGPENTVGCFYHCPTPTQGSEICDGIDNDCNGCVDDGLAKPANFCATKGVCGAPGVQPIAINCTGSQGWQCNYSTITGISIDAMGNLTSNEKQCDFLDNNCDGNCDENFPDVPIVPNPAGPPAGTTCGNKRPAHSCTVGLGKCQNSADYTCTNSGMGNLYNDQESCSVSPKGTPTAELCNGIDDNCNGLVDEAKDDPVTGLAGVHDPVAVVNVPAAPAGCTDPILPNGTDPCKAHTVYMYEYEASRPDASGVSSGSNGTRACSNAGMLPWSNVTLAQAQAACQAIKDPTTGTVSIGRLCTAWEWTSACVGVPGSQAGSSHWSIDANGAAPGAFTNASYTPKVCNNLDETNERCSVDAQCIRGPGSCVSGICSCTKDADCNAGFHCNIPTSQCQGSGAWPTGSKGDDTSNTCFTPYVDAKGVNAGVYDMTGNVGEWTQTTVVTATGVNASVGGFASGVQTITGLTNGIYNTDVGAQLTVTGAATPGNNGTFVINSVTFVPATSTSTVTVQNPSGTATDTKKVSWSLIYNKNRGGSFTSNQGGGVCEFDFVIQKAAFFNTDLGFRCCFDQAP